MAKRMIEPNTIAQPMRPEDKFFVPKETQHVERHVIRHHSIAVKLDNCVRQDNALDKQLRLKPHQHKQRQQLRQLLPLKPPLLHHRVNPNLEHAMVKHMIEICTTAPPMMLDNKFSVLKETRHVEVHASTHRNTVANLDNCAKLANAVRIPEPKLAQAEKLTIPQLHSVVPPLPMPRLKYAQLDNIVAETS